MMFLCYYRCYFIGFTLSPVIPAQAGIQTREASIFIKDSILFMDNSKSDIFLDLLCFFSLDSRLRGNDEERGDRVFSSFTTVRILSSDRAKRRGTFVVKLIKQATIKDSSSLHSNGMTKREAGISDKTKPLPRRRESKYAKNFQHIFAVHFLISFWIPTCAGIIKRGIVVRFTRFALWL
jgi:hypothetical protein